ncbi:stage II sporulation protein R [Evansella sp. AB-P1]|uniref:stage II sporulation protein R n=1 Tax=Evansella sp. AB-P1 TaxID=3037653 RepID=UPI00241DC06E|nr:stage II sporulation protein R [Evansella sp. AB-P1]MDG5787330.1 stage II sporulation protein R [Evansella sp. AB-P1]
MNERIKTYILLVLSILILSWESHVILPVQADEEQAIPEDSIRLRILANSNTPIDQTVKRDIRDAVNAQITLWVQELTELTEARDIIGENIDEINEIVAEKLDEVGSDEPFDVSLKETNFPTKLYGSRLYPAGTYEAVQITIGDGQGDNWWCVLFPPLCFLDFSNGDAVDHETNDLSNETNGMEETESSNDNLNATSNEKSGDTEGHKTDEEEVKVSFFIVDVVMSIWDRLWN